tara:strand:- start:1 stop:453 length:453 start_codon:yes stop_codon:yes gene_type:complete
MKKVLYPFIILFSFLFADSKDGVSIEEGIDFYRGLPSELVLQNLSNDEKLDLYNSKKITFLKNMLPYTRAPLSKRFGKILIYGYAISASIFTYGWITGYEIENRAFSDILVYSGFAGFYGTNIMLFFEQERQRRLFNEELYNKIFLSKPK